MSDPLEELRERLNRESAESDAKLQEFVREGITEEQLREDWRHFRGHGAPPADPQSSLDLWREFLAAIWAAHIPQRVVAGVAIVAVLIVGWSFLSPRGVLLGTDQSWQVEGVPLPSKMRLTSSGGVLLAANSLKLEAALGEGRRGASNEVQAFQIHFEGRTSSGEKIQFNGTLVITNAPGTTSLSHKRDIRGAVLAGEWQVGSQLTNVVSPVFVP